MTKKKVKKERYITSTALCLILVIILQLLTMMKLDKLKDSGCAHELGTGLCIPDTTVAMPQYDSTNIISGTLSIKNGYLVGRGVYTFPVHPPSYDTNLIDYIDSIVIYRSVQEDCYFPDPHNQMKIVLK